MSYSNLKDYFEQPVIMTPEEMDRHAQEGSIQELLESITDINREMGSGYAEANPILIAGLMKVRAQHFNTLFLTKAIQEATGSICAELEAVWDGYEPKNTK